MLFGTQNILMVPLRNLYSFINCKIYHQYMIDKACILCEDFPALHKITITNGDTVTVHYLCTLHFQEVKDSRRFFSLLDNVDVPHQEYYDISEFMTD